MGGRFSTPPVDPFRVCFGIFFHTGVILNEPSSRWAEIARAQLHKVDENSNSVRL